jgi:hypothetical protein
MKNLLLGILIGAVLGGMLALAKRTPPVTAPNPVEAPAPSPAPPEPAPAPSAPEPRQAPPVSAPKAPASALSRPVVAAAPAAPAGFDLNQALTSLADSTLTYAQNQTLWGEVLHRGLLDQTITALEQRIAQSSASALEFAALGHACFLKAGTVQDNGERAALGLKIDHALEQALKLDPTSWEAQFDKAVSLSYWPAYLGKDQEVVEQFVSLIQQQETQPSQPQYAQTYLKLGEQYQKLGYTNYAHEAWQRGATLFPDNASLQKLVQRN